MDFSSDGTRAVALSSISASGTRFIRGKQQRGGALAWWSSSVNYANLKYDETSEHRIVAAPLAIWQAHRVSVGFGESIVRCLAPDGLTISGNQPHIRLLIFRGVGVAPRLLVAFWDNVLSFFSAMTSTGPLP